MDFDDMLYDTENDDLKPSIMKLHSDDLMAWARQYVSKTDTLYELAKNIRPIEGFEDFLIHGKPDSVGYYTTNGQWIQLSPTEFAEYLKNDKEYRGGNVRLLACQSGMLNNGFAQQLADALHVSVMAPTETLWVNKYGEMFIADSEILADLWDSGEAVRQTGVWKVFSPH